MRCEEYELRKEIYSSFYALLWYKVDLCCEFLMLYFDSFVKFSSVCSVQHLMVFQSVGGV